MHMMIMHKNDPKTEAGEKPPMDLITKMGAFIGEHAKAGKLIDGAGLSGSKTRTRLVFRDGRGTVKQGPYRGEHELPAATLLLKVRTREEAIGWPSATGRSSATARSSSARSTSPGTSASCPRPRIRRCRCC